MREEIKHDLISIWGSALELIEEGHYQGLLSLSNHTIHNASIYNDEFSITAAVIVYSLSKIAQRGRLNVANVVSHITRLMQDLSKRSDAAYRKTQKEMLGFIDKADTKFNLYIDDVLKQAKVKKAWKVYDHGLSAGAVAELVGVSQWDLMGYIGNTRVAETPVFKTDIKSRLAYARHLFSK